MTECVQSVWLEMHHKLKFRFDKHAFMQLYSPVAGQPNTFIDANGVSFNVKVKWVMNHDVENIILCPFNLCCIHTFSLPLSQLCWYVIFICWFFCRGLGTSYLIPINLIPWLFPPLAQLSKSHFSKSKNSRVIYFSETYTEKVCRILCS